MTIRSIIRARRVHPNESLMSATRCWWTESFMYPTRSMMKSLLPGDRFMVEKLAHRLCGVRRGDIVAYRTSLILGEERVHCHRVVGLGGDRIALRDEVLYRNGEAIAESFAAETIVA